MARGIKFSAIAPVFFIFIISMSIAAYADYAPVGYVVKYDNRAVLHYIDILNDMGFSVEIINENRLASVNQVNFSNYSFFLINDDIFKDGKRLPVNSYPSLILNTANLKDIHWAGSGSMVSSSSYLRGVVANDTHFITKDTSSPFNLYIRPDAMLSTNYLAKNFKAPFLTTIVSTTTNSGDAIIATAVNGTRLRDSKISQSKGIFFGISQTREWTQDSDWLFRQSVRWLVSDLIPPIITDFDIAEITDNSVIFIWDSDKNGTYSIYYGKMEDGDVNGTGFEQIISGEMQEGINLAQLENLEGFTQYGYVIEVCNDDSICKTLPLMNFKTLDPTMPVVVSVNHYPANLTEADHVTINASVYGVMGIAGAYLNLTVGYAMPQMITMHYKYSAEAYDKYSMYLGRLPFNATVSYNVIAEDIDGKRTSSHTQSFTVLPFDSDGDGVYDHADVFPYDPTRYTDKTLINEIYPYGQNWVEVYNSDIFPMDISGWRLSDGTIDLYVFEQGTVLDVAERYVADELMHTINRTGKVYLYDITDELQDSYSYDSSYQFGSVGRIHDGRYQWVNFSQPTKELPNNRLPEVTISNQTLDENDEMSIDLLDYINDPDGDQLSFEVTVNNPDEVDCQLYGSILIIEPAPYWNGQTQCTIRIDDGYGDIIRDVQIFVIDVPNPPYFLNEFDDISIIDGVVFNLQLEAIDPDGDGIIFTSNITNIGGTIDADSGLISWLPTLDNLGTYHIRVRACDDAIPSSCIDETFWLTVRRANEYPVFSHPFPDVEIFEEQLFYMNVNATDPDGDTLEYRSNITEIGGTINMVTGVIRLEADDEQVGVHDISVSVCDGVNECVTEVFRLTVIEVNDRPQIVKFYAEFFEGESAYANLDDFVIDPDNLPEEMIWSVYHEGNLNITLDEENRTLNISAKDNTWNGEDSFILSVSDGELNDSAVIPVNVIGVIEFSEIVVTIDGTEFSVNDGDTVGPAGPDSEVSLRLRISNNYPESNQFIEQVVLSARIDSDIGYETTYENLFIINGNTGFIRELEFQRLPLTVDRKGYELIIHAQGTDHLGVLRSREFSAIIEYETENNDIRIFNESFSYDRLSCYRQTELDYMIVNAGETTQHVRVWMQNSELGLNASQMVHMPAKHIAHMSYPISIMEGASGNFPIVLTAEFDDGEGGLDSFSKNVNLELEACFSFINRETYEDSGENIIVDVHQYMNENIIAKSDFMYSIIGQTSDYLMGCSISGSIITCGPPIKDQAGVKKVLVGASYGGFANSGEFMITVHEINDPVTIPHTIPNVTFLEKDSYELDLSGYIYDPDTPLSEMVWSSSVNDKVSVNFDGNTATFSTFDKDWWGTEYITLIVSDGESFANQTIVVTVIQVKDTLPMINYSYPLNKNMVVGDGHLVDYTIGLYDPDIFEPTISWYVNGILQVTGISEKCFSFASNSNFKVLVNITNATIGNMVEWDVIVSKVPVSERYSGTINDVTESDVSAFSGLTIYNQYGMIDFGEQQLDLSEVIDVDSNVWIEHGRVGINTTAFPSLSGKEATITLYGLSNKDVPEIFLMDSTGAVVLCNDCMVNTYSGGILSFNTTGFSTLFVEIPNLPPVINSIPTNTGRVGAPYSYQVSATDPEGDSLHYSVIGDATGISITQTGAVSWTPSTPGSYNVTIIVNDGNNQAVQAYTLAVADRDRLEITGVEVDVAGRKTRNLVDGDLISRTASPGDSIEFDIEIANTFADNTDIEDIEVEIVIVDIDDRDDIEGDAEISSLRAGRERKVSIPFTLPYAIEDGFFDVEISVTGRSEDGTRYEIFWVLELEVKKERHLIQIYQASINRQSVSCERDIRIDFGVRNIGLNDEDVVLKVMSEQLDILEEFRFRLSERVYDSNNRYQRQITAVIDDDVPIGTYPIELIAEYNSRSERETLMITVNECQTPASSTSSTSSMVAGTDTIYTNIDAARDGVQMVYTTLSGSEKGVSGTIVSSDSSISQDSMRLPKGPIRQQLEPDTYLVLLVIGVVALFIIVSFMIGVVIRQMYWR